MTQQPSAARANDPQAGDAQATRSRHALVLVAALVLAAVVGLALPGGVDATPAPAVETVRTVSDGSAERPAGSGEPSGDPAGEPRALASEPESAGSGAAASSTGPVRAPAEQFAPLRPRRSQVSGLTAGSAGEAVAGSRASSPAPAGPTNSVSLRPIARLELPGVETLAYDARTNMLFASHSVGRVAGRDVPAGLAMIHVGSGDDAVFVRTMELAAAAGLPAGMDASVTHVAVDPAGRGFGVATVAPEPSTSVPGALVAFSTRTGRALAAVSVGYHPDAAAFSPAGDVILVANEGEPSVDEVPGGGSGGDQIVRDQPGSVSLVRLGGIASEADIEARLVQSAVTTVVPTGRDLRQALQPDSPAEPRLRIHPFNAASPTLDLEPEYVAIVDRLAYVSFQENNAIGVFDLDTARWLDIRPLGGVARTIDASATDGDYGPDQTLYALPMPDQLATFEHDGRLFVVTADEGDERGSVEAGEPLADAAALGWLASTGRLSAEFATFNDLAAGGMGDVRVSAFDGDLDGDGAIDRPHVHGARSITVWDGLGLSRVGDTGSAFETAIARDYSGLFNASGRRDFAPADRRSTARGPEPEGIVVVNLRRADRASARGLAGRPVAVVTLERPGLVAAVDLSTPTSPRLAGLYPSAYDGDRGPEGLAVLEGLTPGSGGGAAEAETLVAVAFELSGTVVVYAVGEAR